MTEGRGSAALGQAKELGRLTGGQGLEVGLGDSQRGDEGKRDTHDWLSKGYRGEEESSYVDGVR